MEKVIAQSFIKASPEKIWRALTNTDEMKNWYFDIPDFKLELHHEFNFYEPGGENKFHHQCKITEIIPLQKFQHTWTYPDFSKLQTLVTWDVKSVGNETHLTLTHSGLENFSDLGDDFSIQNFKQGWESIINNSLKPYLENQ